MLDPVSLGEVRRRIAAAQEFLRKHKKVFTNRYYTDPECNPASNPSLSEDANHHYTQLDLAAKWFMAEGGQVPGVLDEILRIHEKLGLLFRRSSQLDQDASCFYTFNRQLTEEVLTEPIQDQDGIAEIIGWTVWRSSLLIRRIPPVLFCEEPERDKPLLYECEEPVTLTDLIHLRIRILCPDAISGEQELQQAGADWGWVAVHRSEHWAKSLAQKSHKDRKRVEGGMRRFQRFHEVSSKKARRKPKKKAKQKANKNPFQGLGTSGLSFLSEVNGKKMISSGALPEFFSGVIGIPHCEVHRGEIPEDVQRQVRATISRRLHDTSNLLLDQILRELTGDISKDPEKHFVHGGRKGLVPANLYRNL